jgi:L-asparaginase / beta-aspartyl-peptidase
MNRFAIAAWMTLMIPTMAAAAGPARPKYFLVMHGGAGTIERKSMTPEKEKEIREAMTTALRTGQSVLEKGGTSVDAVEAAIRVLEDSPLFNAGKGAVFTHEGRNELDASIMDGRTRKAGAVAGVTIIRNPISAARAVMEKSPHVLLIGRGAELFATKMGLEIVDPSYFWTEVRWKALQQELLKENEKKPESHSENDGGDDHAYGTVGAVALDQYGNLAAGTSTGGMTNKYFGRVGDSPIIGAGNYADDTVAVSGTGTGEYFIRLVVAHDIAALVEYKGMTLAAAAREVVHHKLASVGGDGGVIALDRNGAFTMPFNTAGMYRGFVGPGGQPQIFIYGDEGSK